MPNLKARKHTAPNKPRGRVCSTPCPAAKTPTFKVFLFFSFFFSFFLFPKLSWAWYYSGVLEAAWPFDAARNRSAGHW